jgi:hypothetical protein
MSPLEVTVPPDMDLLTSDSRIEPSFPGRVVGANYAFQKNVLNGDLKSASTQELKIQWEGQ